MLVLSRKKNERIMIPTSDGLIEVFIADIRGENVRLGFIAPRHIKIKREEIYDGEDAKGPEEEKEEDAE